MAPPPAAKSGSSARRKEKAPATLFVKTKYLNNLPAPPFDCKFVSCPFVDLKRFVEYKPTSLESRWKRDLLTEPDLGVKVDLIDPETYRPCDPDNMPDMHPIDRHLLEEDVVNTATLKRSAQHHKVVPWMRKTEYISSELNRVSKTANRQETSLGYNIRRDENTTLPQETLRTVEAQIAAIDTTFTKAARSLVGRRHPSKAGVTAVDELAFLPDAKLWRNPFAQVTFDADPRPPNTSDLMVDEKMKSALIRGMQDETGQFVAYFVPTDKTLAQRAMRASDAAAGTSAADDGEQAADPDEYMLLRNYTWTVLSKTSKGYEQAYVVAMRDGTAYYNELETRVKLSRRRVAGVPQAVTTTRMYLTRAPETEAEVAFRDGRLTALRAAHENEEEAAPADDDGGVVAPAVDDSSDEEGGGGGEKASDESDKQSSGDDD